MADEQMSVSRTVDASPAQVFAVLTDPAKHAEIDGAGMLRGSEGATKLSAVGDVFMMDMNNQILGDYRMRNTVTAFEQDRTLGWAPMLTELEKHSDKLGDIKPGGHTYTWHLEPEGSGTKVTQVYDWSGVGDPRFKGFCPMLTADQLGESIERAGRAVG